MSKFLPHNFRLAPASEQVNGADAVFYKEGCSISSTGSLTPVLSNFTSGLLAATDVPKSKWKGKKDLPFYLAANPFKFRQN